MKIRHDPLGMVILYDDRGNKTKWIPSGARDTIASVLTLIIIGPRNEAIPFALHPDCLYYTVNIDKEYETIVFSPMLKTFSVLKNMIVYNFNNITNKDTRD